MKFLITLFISAIFSTPTFAQLEIILNDSRMTLAASAEGEFKLTRNSDSPTKVKLLYGVFVAENRCIESEMRPWWVERHCIFMGFKPGSSETLESCTEGHYIQKENCVRSEKVMVEQSYQIELNFSRALKLSPDQEETFFMTASLPMNVSFSGKDASKYDIRIQKRFLKSPTAVFNIK